MTENINISINKPIKIKTGCLSKIIYFIVFLMFVGCFIEYLNTRNIDRPNSSITFNNMYDFINDKKLTKIQIDDKFNQMFYNKKVTWSGNLIGAEKQTFGYKVLLDNGPLNIIIEMNDSNGNKLININKGILVRYSGIIDSYDSYGIYLKNGEIIEVIQNDDISIDRNSVTIEQEKQIKEQLTQSTPTPIIVKKVQVQPTIDNQTKDKCIDVSYKDFLDIFKNSNTKNKESLFCKNYRNKRVTWNGSLISFEEKYTNFYDYIKEDDNKLE